MDNRVVIDCFPESALRYRADYTIVVIDVIRATTSGTTALSYGRRVFPVQTTDEAFIMAKSMRDPLLVGELGGNVPYGFHFTNSPVLISALSAVPSGSFSDIQNPIIFLSSSGTQLLKNAAGSEAVYLSCFRNFSAVAKHIAGRHGRVAILGAGTRGQFRREDQIGCAWTAQKLVEAGYEIENKETEEIISRWADVNLEVVREGRSAKYLRDSGQAPDLEFILHYIDDLEVVPMLINGELVMAAGSPQPKSPK